MRPKQSLRPGQEKEEKNLGQSVRAEQPLRAQKVI
jgi:hypothetical protein